jgi:Ca2+-binding RTX toxin-like protein
MPQIEGGGARDTLTGTAGADTLSGRDGSDSLAAGAGDDVIYGFGVEDTVAGSSAITAVRVASGLNGPLFAASPPGDPDRLFIVEQHTGRIMILDTRSNTLNPQPFLDLPNGSLANGFEQGLLGLAFHPNYATNGKFYIYLTNPAGDTRCRNTPPRARTRRVRSST